MPKDVHAIAGRGVADLEEAVLSVLQTARTNREGTGASQNRRTGGHTRSAGQATGNRYGYLALAP